MNSSLPGLSAAQKKTAIQRLTALWAFTESGLGGVMHAFQFPFTGLLVGGMAVVMICLIAFLSGNNYRQVLKSALLVLIVKAMVSPYTPFPAYIAVSFQALLGYSLFRIIGLNMISILFLSVIAMVESAIQKILILTLFFGESFWKAMNGLVNLLAKQFGWVVSNGGYWIVAVYLAIYAAGGIVVAWLAFRTLRSFTAETLSQHLRPTDIRSSTAVDYPAEPGSKNKFKKLWKLVAIMIAISVLVYLMAGNQKTGWLAVIKTISWTLSAILVWFMLISPLLTKGIQKILRRQQSRYSQEVLHTLSFIPVLKTLTVLAWRKSNVQAPPKRFYVFFTSLVHSTLIYTDPDTENKTA